MTTAQPLLALVCLLAPALYFARPFARAMLPKGQVREWSMDWEG